MPSRTPKTKSHAGPTGAVERLYMMYFAGVVLAMLAIVVLAIFTTSRLDRLADRQAEMVGRITTLETEVLQLVGAVADRPISVDLKPPTAERVSRPPASQPAAQSGPGDDGQVSRGVAPPVLDTDAVMRLYAECVRAAPRGLFEISDTNVARDLLERAASAFGSDTAKAWSGQALVSLAILSRLFDDDGHAREFSAAARVGGFDATQYDEFSARALLDADRPAESGLFSRAVRQNKERSVQGAVLQAASFVARRNLNAAREVVSGLNELGVLADYDRLRLARVYIELERWDDLRRALHGLDDVDAVLAYERDFFRSIWLIYDGSLAEADAVLAFLLEQKQDDYEAATWRGVVLMRAGQPEAARGALVRAADLAPGRPEAWYWLAVLELKNGNDQAGEQHLNKSLAASALYAPAWEALATIAIKRDDFDTALDRLSAAARHDVGRANVHLLIALCFAQKEQRDEAAAALRTAFAIDRSMIERAAGMDALAQMFERAELEALLRAEGPSDSAENP